MNLSNDETRYVEKEGAEFLEFTAFDNYRDKMTAAFVIKGRRSQHYCGLDADCMEIINRALGLKDVLQIKKQVHGDTNIIIDSMNEPEECDGMITGVPRLPLATRVADCIAVLMFDPTNNIVANVHSGWRGTVKRIAPKAVLKMRDELLVNPANLICVLCPSICFKHFEVDNDVRELFAKEFDESHLEDVGEKTHIDAAAYLADSLIEVGVFPQNIHNSGICTVCNSDYLFSYRAEKHIEQRYRNVAIISLK